MKGFFKRDSLKNINYSTLHEMLYSVAEKFGNKSAFILKDKLNYSFSVSYFNLLKDVESIGTSLIKMGYKNKKIAIIGKNSYKWAVSYLAASCVGIVIPIDKELPSNNIINLLNFSEASIVLGDEENLINIFECQKYLINPIVFVNFDSKTNTDFYFGFDALKSSGLYNLDNKNSFRELNISSDEPHFLIFSSETSKYFLRSHKSICSDIVLAGSEINVNISTFCLSSLSMAHFYECILGFLLIISHGGTISFSTDPNKIIDDFVEFKPTMFLGDPFILDKLKNLIIQMPVSSKHFSEEKHIMDCVSFFQKPFIAYKIRKNLGGNLKTFIIVESGIDYDLLLFFKKYNFKVFPVYDVTDSSEATNEFKENISTEITDLIVIPNKKKFDISVIEYFLDFIACIINFFNEKLKKYKKVKETEISSLEKK